MTADSIESVQEFWDGGGGNGGGDGNGDLRNALALIQAVAAALGALLTSISPGTIRQGLPSRMHHPSTLTPDEKRALAPGLRQQFGWAPQRIANYLGVPYATVWSWLHLDQSASALDRWLERIEGRLYIWRLHDEGLTEQQIVDRGGFSTERINQVLAQPRPDPNQPASRWVRTSDSNSP